MEVLSVGRLHPEVLRLTPGHAQRVICKRLIPVLSSQLCVNIFEGVGVILTWDQQE